MPGVRSKRGPVHALTLALLLALFPWSPPANAGERIESTKKLGKNYFVVRRPSSDECSVVAKKVPNDLVVVGKGLYASEQYARAALETFPECKSEKIRSSGL